MCLNAGSNTRKGWLLGTCLTHPSTQRTLDSRIPNKCDRFFDLGISSLILGALTQTKLAEGGDCNEMQVGSTFLKEIGLG